MATSETYKNRELNPYLEYFIITISLIAILVSIRFLSKTFLIDNWLGALGIVSLVLGGLLYLAKKDKLGLFGTMLIRQIIKHHSGKRKWLVCVQISVFLAIAFFTVFCIHMGNTEFSSLKEQVLEEFHNQEMIIDSEVNYDVLQTISSKISPEEQFESLVNLPTLTIHNFEVFSVVLAISDQLLAGWVMYFWQVMIIETVEIMIFLVVSKKLFFKTI